MVLRDLGNYLLYPFENVAWVFIYVCALLCVCVFLYMLQEVIMIGNTVKLFIITLHEY